MILESNSFQQFDNESYHVKWQGFLYLPGIKSGKESLSEFLALLKKNSIEKIASQLKGQYFISIKDQQEGIEYAFTDGNGVYHAFYSQQYISDSFLKLTQHLQLKKEDLNPSAMAEFMHWGNLHYDRTFFAQIKKVQGKQIFKMKDEQFSIIEKEHVALSDRPDQYDFFSLLKTWCDSIREEKVSIDITGGIDSRLLVAALEYFKVPYELAISGMEQNIDIVYAKKIAQLLQKKLVHTTHDLSHLEEELTKINSLSEALVNPLNYHRLYQHQQNRKKEGYTFSISGAGGEVYKEFVWLQDFPFYHKKHTNLDRFYYLRFSPVRVEPNILTEQYQQASKELKENILQEVKAGFLKESNTQSYDNIYFTYKWPMFYGRFITNNSQVIPCYAPFLEMELAQYSYHLKRRERSFNRLHRKWISQFHPALSKMSTTEGGMSMSNQPLYMLIDRFKYVLDRSKRLGNKIGQKLLGKSLLQHHAPNHPDFYQKTKASKLFLDAFDHLQEEGILNPELQASQAKEKYLGNIIALSYLLKRL